MDPKPTKRRTGGETLGWVGAVAELMLADVAAGVRAVGSTVGQARAEGPIPTIAFALVFASPRLLAVLGLLTTRPAMIGAGGVACLPLGMVSIITIPIWIPAIVLLVAFGRASKGPHPKGGPVRTTATIGVAVLGLIVATGLLVVGMKPYTYEYATGGESGDYVPVSHAAAAVGLLGIELVLTTVVAPKGAVELPGGR